MAHVTITRPITQEQEYDCVLSITKEHYLQQVLFITRQNSELVERISALKMTVSKARKQTRCGGAHL